MMTRKILSSFVFSCLVLCPVQMDHQQTIIRFPSFESIFTMNLYVPLLHSSDVFSVKVSELINELKGNYAQVYRDQAKMRLVQLGSNTIPYLAAYLKEEDPDISFMVLQVVEEIGDPRSVKIVLNFLENSQNTDLVCQSIKTLGKLKSPFALQKLLILLRDAPESYFFEEDVQKIVGVTLWAVSEIGDPRCAKPILEFAKSNPKPQYLIYCASALGKINDSKSREFLMDLLKHRDADVRLTAAQSLASFAEPSLLGFLWNAFENESDLEVKLAITDIISAIGGEMVIKTFIEMLKTGRDYASQHFAERALKSMGKKAVPMILISLDQTDVEQRINSARILSDIGTSEAVPKLAKMAQEKNAVVQIAAIEALGKCGDETVLNLLTRLSLSFNKTIRRSARSARERVLMKMEGRKG